MGARLKVIITDGTPSTYKALGWGERDGYDSILYTRGLQLGERDRYWDNNSNRKQTLKGE